MSGTLVTFAELNDLMWTALGELRLGYPIERYSHSIEFIPLSYEIVVLEMQFLSYL